MSRFMKTKLFLLMTGFGLILTAAEVRADGCPSNCNIGFHCNINNGGCNPTLAPWYAYFPYEAHFQMPAPIGMYPNWPTPFPPAANPAVPPPPPETPQSPRKAPPTPISAQQPPIQPIGYYNYYGYGYGYGNNYGYGYRVPAYWYGR